MAIAFTITNSISMADYKGKMVYGTIAFDSSYPTGGEVITPGKFGFRRAIGSITFSGGQNGLAFEYDEVNSKIIVKQPCFTRTCLNPGEAQRDLEAVAADVTIFQVGTNLYVVGLSSVVTEEVHASTGVPVMSLEKRDADAASNAVELATITYVNHDAVGAVDSYMTGAGAVGGGATVASALATPYRVLAGYTLVLKHKTAATDGTAADGGAKCHIWVASTDANVELPNAFDLSAWTAVQFVATGN